MEWPTYRYGSNELHLVVTSGPSVGPPVRARLFHGGNAVFADFKPVPRMIGIGFPNFLATAVARGTEMNPQAC